MSIFALVVIAKTIGLWTNVFLCLAVIATSLILANRGRKLMLAIALDLVQLYSSWMQARQDAEHKNIFLAHERAKLMLYQGEARLLLRDQRRQLLAELESEATR